MANCNFSATNIHSLKLRRLSTVSSAKAPPGHIYSTKWRWYWKDENNKWQSYDTPDDDHAASTASSDVFEKNFQSSNLLNCSIQYIYLFFTLHLPSLKND